MPKFLTVMAAAAFSAFMLCACQALPEGAERPDISIDSVTIAAVDGVPGFKVSCSMEHNSLTALPLQSTEITVFINGTMAARYQEPGNFKELPPNQRLTLNYFVPATLLPEVASYSLKYNRMLQLQASVLVHLSFEKDNKSGFNPNATFEGIILHE